jgi:hypothetical protein
MHGGPMKKIFPGCIRVMPEYGSSGIWVVKPMGLFRHGMIEHRSLGLREDLAQGFRNWIDQYTTILENPQKFDTVTFNEEGRRLAGDLKKHVGPKTTVLFVPQEIDGGLGAEEEIH